MNKNDFQDLFYQLEQMSTLLNQLNKLSSQTNQILRSLQYFSSANFPQIPNKENEKNPNYVTGDSFYNLFNSPNMIGIVKEIMNKRKK